LIHTAKTVGASLLAMTDLQTPTIYMHKRDTKMS